MLSFIYNSPVGALKVTISDNFVQNVDFYKKTAVKSSIQIPKNTFAYKVKTELDEYFEGERETFSIRFKLNGTEFQKSVWKEMTKIKYSKTISYKDVAQRINKPKALRAVGTACGRNPVAVVVPCHRIVSSSGLGGFGGGLWRKKWLLNHEKRKV